MASIKPLSQCLKRQYWWSLEVKLLEVKLLETKLFEVKSLEVKLLKSEIIFEQVKSL